MFGVWDALGIERLVEPRSDHEEEGPPHLMRGHPAE